MDDKRIRQLVIAVLVIIGILGVISLVSTLVQMIVPLAIVAAGVFAFYKIVLEGRDKSEAMEDEVAETSGLVVQATAEPVVETVETPAEVQEEEQPTPEQRLSKADQARLDYVDKQTPAEEILDQIKARRQRLQGDEE